MPLRALVLEEAFTWMGTPFAMNAAVKGPQGGVDCSRFIWESYRKLGIPVPALPEHWPLDWFMHKMADAEPLLNLIRSVYLEVESPQPADIAVFRKGRALSHSALVVHWPRLIHAHAFGLGSTVQYGDARQWPLAGHEVRFFSPFASGSL
jgi:cell wall-associated NlpC family hydrolase